MSRAPTPTHCPYCSLQCGIVMSGGPGPDALQPQPDFPTNRGGLCSKGWSAAALLDHPRRLLRPLVRSVPGDRTSPFREAGWDEALDLVADGIRDAQKRHGRDAVGCFGGGGMTNEKAYALGKFARVGLRTSAIDYNGRFCMSSAATAGTRAFGVDRGLPFPLADVAEADAVLLVGSNPAATMPPAMQFFDAARAAGAFHAVVDPRRTATAQTAALHLQPLPGTDLALANGLLHVAVKEGLVDQEYVEARTTGFERVRTTVAAYWPDRVERITGVPVTDLVATVRALGTAERAMILTARGAEQHAQGTDTAQAFVNLALALGLPGRPGSGYGTITGQGNGQGGREHGLKADQLPGYRKLDDPAARAHVAAVWGVDPADLPQPGRSAYEMLDRLGTDDGVRALLVMASNIAVSAPDLHRVVDRLGALDLLVVSDIFCSETAELADVVLPTTQWAEEEGTLTNLEGRVIRRRRAMPPPEGVLDDLAVIKKLADRLGTGRHFSADPETVFDELRRASAGGPADYSGLDYARIEAERGVFWPCPAPDHPGTPRLFADSFPTADGRARFWPVEHREVAERPSTAYPYVLTTGRLMGHYQSGTQTRRLPRTVQAQSQPEAQVHPDLARRLGVGAGDIVRLTSPRGAAVLRAHLSDEIRADTVFVPFHWGGASAANALTDARLDPHSRMPSFKACAVALERVGSADDEGGRLSPPPDQVATRLLPRPTGPGPPAASAGVPTDPPTPTSSARPPTTRHMTGKRRMITKNRFLQGLYPFEGAGLDAAPVPIHDELTHTVPDGVVNQTLYFRGGNTSDDLVTVVLTLDGSPMRYFPIGARSDVHVPLRVVEDVEGGSVLDLRLVAEKGVIGTLVVDLGMVEH